MAVHNRVKKKLSRSANHQPTQSLTVKKMYPLIRAWDRLPYRFLDLGQRTRVSLSHLSFEPTAHGMSRSIARMPVYYQPSSASQSQVNIPRVLYRSVLWRSWQSGHSSTWPSLNRPGRRYWRCWFPFRWAKLAFWQRSIPTILKRLREVQPLQLKTDK